VRWDNSPKANVQFTLQRYPLLWPLALLRRHDAVQSGVVYDGLELFFTALLVATTLTIAGIAGFIIYKLFAGQK